VKEQSVRAVVKGLCGIALACLILPVWAASLSGEVIKVQDGDTVDVLVNRKPVRIRLAEIDAPEKKQPFGERSRQTLISLVYRKQVTVAVQNKDRYGRVVGTIYLQGSNINKEMVRKGMAWAYKDYLKDLDYVTIQDQARAAKRGLWADKSPQAPWAYRKAKRDKHASKS
jgi:micrococcal nuclease